MYKRKVKVISSVLATTQNSLTYPECRKEKDAQKEQLNKKLNRILLSSRMEIEKQNIEFDQRFKFKLDEIEREMKKTRDRLVHYQKELCYSRHMTEWFKQKPPVGKGEKGENGNLVLPYINIDKNNMRAKQRKPKKGILKNKDNTSELKKDEARESNKDTLKNVEIVSEESKENEEADQKNRNNDDKEFLDNINKKGAEYEIKFSSDRPVRKKRHTATFLQRNYKRNKERILFSYLIEKKQFQYNQTKYFDERIELIRNKLKTFNF